MIVNLLRPSRFLPIAGLLSIATLSLCAQTPTKAPPKSPPRAAAPKPAASAPAAAPSTTPPAAPAGSTLEAKGFSRIEVTPQYKDDFQKEIRVAVVVAPNYRNSGLTPLRFTVTDTMDLKAEFERLGYKVWLISPAEATSDNIRRVLSDSKQLLDGTNNATFIFAFSGHGFQTAKGNYLVTVGATPDNVETEALSLEEVQKLMTDSGARRKVILIDACRNDPEAKSADKPRTFGAFQAAEGTSILLSTRPGGFSYEDPELGHGIFTYYVLEGLRGKAAGKDGYVTFHDLETYVSNSVVDAALKKDRVQRPFVTGERSGDFLLSVAAPPKPDELPKRPEGSESVNSDTLVLREIGGSGRSFFALLDTSKLTLVDSKTLAPFYELNDTGATDLTAPYKHFRGNGPNREVIEAAVEVKGSDIVGFKSRIGSPCPQDKPCSTPNQVPLLPGEKGGGEVRGTVNNVGNAANAARNGLSRLGLGRSSNNANKTAVGAETATQTMDSANPLLKFTWKSFELTSNLPKK